MTVVAVASPLFSWIMLLLGLIDLWVIEKDYVFSVLGVDWPSLEL